MDVTLKVLELKCISTDFIMRFIYGTRSTPDWFPFVTEPAHVLQKENDRFTFMYLAGPLV